MNGEQGNAELDERGRQRNVRTADPKRVEWTIARPALRHCGWGIACVWLLMNAGCSSMKVGMGGIEDMRGWAREHSIRRPDIGEIRGPNERNLTGVNERWRETTAKDTREFEAAKALYDEGKYNKAESVLVKYAKRYRAPWYKSFVGWDGEVNQQGWAYHADVNEWDGPYKEDVLFMLGECRYAQGELPKALDSYERLIKEYPSTRHINHVSQQLFRISRAWLDLPEIGESKDVAQVGFREGDKKAPPATKGGKSYSSLPNFSDKSRPTMGTEERALHALKLIWLNDTTGPLADDALMLTANHYLRAGNYSEAAQTYGLLREQYPQSPHLKDAYLLESHVRLASYDGPSYDNRNLQEAKKLKEASLRLFGDLTEEQRARLQDELKRIDEAEVARVWNQVEFYRQKGNKKAMQLYCNMILNKYPDSEYAERARKTLSEIMNSRGGGGFLSWGRKNPASGGDQRPVEEEEEEANGEETDDEQGAEETEEATDETQEDRSNEREPRRFPGTEEDEAEEEDLDERRIPEEEFAER